MPHKESQPIPETQLLSGRALRQFLYEGADATHLLENIRWHNLRCDGVLITDKSQLKVSKNAFVANITYGTKGAP